MDITTTQALSRRDQPTSRIAARRVESSGAGETQRAMVLQAVIDNPGKTGRELEAITGLESHRIASRLAELKTDGKVWNGDKRQCDVANQECKTWWPSAAIEIKPVALPAPANYPGKAAEQARINFGGER